jgi:hypothetical protein
MHELIEIACAGCGRTQRVRAAKVRKADYYTCDYGTCAKNPKGIESLRPEGFITELDMNAAGGFTGVTVRHASPSEWASDSRCRVRRGRDSGIVRNVPLGVGGGN